MTSLLQMISEAIQRDVDHLTVLPDSQSIYLELGPRRWSLTLKELTEPVADRWQAVAMAKLYRQQAEKMGRHG